MPKILPILISYGIVISVLLWAGMAGAATVSWDKDIVETDLAGFKIYVNGEMAKDVADPTLCIGLMGCAKSVPMEMEWITPAPDASGIAYAALTTDDRPLILNEPRV